MSTGEPGEVEGAFAQAAGRRPRLGWCYAAEPLPATVACARIWASRRRGLACELVTLHAITRGGRAVLREQRDPVLDALVEVSQ